MKHVNLPTFILLNLFFGSLFFIVLLLWVFGISFTAQDLGLILVDPSLDSGTGFPFLIIAFLGTLLYFPIPFFYNRYIYKIWSLSKSKFYSFFVTSFLTGLLIVIVPVTLNWK